MIGREEKLTVSTSSPSLTASPPPSRTKRAPIQLASFGVGAVFLLVGTAGFIPGITQNLDHLQLAGHEGHALLLGVFHVSVLHNVVHLLFGIVGVLVARKAAPARRYLLWGGLVYLILFLYGLVVDFSSAANFVPLSDANNLLHLVLAVVMIALSFLPRRRVAVRDVLGPAAET